MPSLASGTDTQARILFFLRQSAGEFDQPLSFDTSLVGVEEMSGVFSVRSTPLAPPVFPQPSRLTCDALPSSQHRTPSFPRVCWGPHCWNRVLCFDGPSHLLCRSRRHPIPRASYTARSALDLRTEHFDTLPRMNAALYFMRPTVSSAARGCFVRRQQAPHLVCLGGQRGLPKHRLLWQLERHMPSDSTPEPEASSFPAVAAVASATEPATAVAQPTAALAPAAAALAQPVATLALAAALMGRGRSRGRRAHE